MEFGAKIDLLDRINPAWLLFSNGVLALLAIISNGGWLILARAGKASPEAVEAAGVWPHVILLVAALLLALSIFAWFRPQARVLVLKVQTFALGCFVAVLFLFAVEMIVQGPPRSVDVVWHPFFVASLVAYAVYLVRRTLIPSYLLQRPVLRYAHVIAAATALLLSVVVLWRISAP